MKTLLASLLLLSSVSAMALSSVLEEVSDDVCKNIKIDFKNDSAVCVGATNVSAVLSAKVGNSLTAAESAYQSLGFYTYGPIEMGIVPDADTNSLFHYERWLLDRAGKRIGVLTISGWENYEMQDSGRMDARYNMKGEVVSIAIKSIR